ncbi:MAG: YicC family protein [Oscillospiraceae bacterium]|nr:YicC family protein [Oscillospiraceae bacterium]
MIKSMTGFGRYREIENEREILAEVKSINSRYLDIYVKAPKIYGFLEDKIKQEAAKFISRGKTEIYIGIDTITDENIKITLNKIYLENYIDILHTIRDNYNLTDDISTMRVAQNRDIYNIEKLEEDEEILWQAVKSALTKAFEEFNNMRITEGERLLQDMSARIKKCGEIADEIKILSDNSKENYYDLFKQRLKDIIGEVLIDESRIITEAAIYADKISITEEIVRLKSHFSQFEKIVKENTPVGRKIDFLVQEINREINTIGSKSLDIEITNRVIEVKSDIEKIREQIQNIE